LILLWCFKLDNCIVASIMVPVNLSFKCFKSCLSVSFCSDELGVDASVAVHVGDDSTNDKQGALAAGLESW
jgi:hypothetical protein